MTVFNRRGFVGSAAALAFMGASAARAETKDVPCTDIFPFLLNYLNLPAAERTHFRLAYKLAVTGAKLSDIRLVLKHNGETPLNVAADNTLTPLPPVAALKAKAPVTVTRPDGSKMGLTLLIAAALPPAAAYAAPDLKKAVDQSRAGAKKAAGVMSLAVPNLDRIVFVGAAGGQAIGADGKGAALPKTKDGHPVFQPAAQAKAARVTLDKAPTLLRIEAKPK
ncbi:hypothetical protein [Asticcacaulis sp. W401b]|uniref:hypothetical protein n=1 Tax=Asticcacaulis sp. W401b TaxID=3388666 RepID=UPI0039705D0E